jgi:hypothetical protein
MMQPAAKQRAAVAAAWRRSLLDYSEVYSNAELLVGCEILSFSRTNRIKNAC